ncbi:integral membrane protein [Geopyxis carbonaria]|nr:integral membrane protein [Geopyxis carbonaria]
MDSFPLSTAPQAYLDIKHIPDFFVALEALGWNLCYIALAIQSLRDRSYGMSLIALCNNMAWELVYSVIYPPAGKLEQGMILLWVLLDVVMMYSALRFSALEWRHAPAVQQLLPVIFAAGVPFCVWGHWALAVQLGPEYGIFWGAVSCQIVLSVGALAQLLTRGSTRGASWAIWWGRFMGTNFSTVVFAYRYLYWHDVFAFVAAPMMRWCLGVQLTVDLAYGYYFWKIRAQEKRVGQVGSDGGVKKL